jgi:hypothetical protein
MNWFELGDQERLCRFADEVCRAGHISDMFATNLAESFFTDIADRHGGGIPDLMRFEPHTIRGLREKFNMLWENSDLPQKDLLIKIVAAAALKNEYEPLDYEHRLYEWKLAVEHDNTQPVEQAVSIQTATNSQESTACPKTDGEDPLISVLVYEF